MVIGDIRSYVCSVRGTRDFRHHTNPLRVLCVLSTSDVEFLLRFE